MNTDIQVTRNRGGCLTLWLILAFLFGSLGTIGYLFLTDTMYDTYPDAPSGIFIAFGILTLIQVVCVVGIWMWKRWGLYGWFVVAFIGLILNFILGEIVSGLVGFVIGSGILLFLIRDKMQEFE